MSRQGIPSGMCEIMDQCLELDPKDRWTAKQALQHPFFADNNHMDIESGDVCMADILSVS